MLLLSRVYVKADKHGTPLNIAAAKNNARFLVRLLTCCQGIFSNGAPGGQDDFTLLMRNTRKDAIVVEAQSSKEIFLLTLLAYWGNKKAAECLVNTYIKDLTRTDRIPSNSIFHEFVSVGRITRTYLKSLLALVATLNSRVDSDAPPCFLRCHPTSLTS